MTKLQTRTTAAAISQSDDRDSAFNSRCRTVAKVSSLLRTGRGRDEDPDNQDPEVLVHARDEMGIRPLDGSETLAFSSLALAPHL
jgi:hypothetical protein